MLGYFYLHWLSYGLVGIAKTHLLVIENKACPTKNLRALNRKNCVCYVKIVTAGKKIGEKKILLGQIRI
jgi:hypothetical protein